MCSPPLVPACCLLTWAAQGGDKRGCPVGDGMLGTVATGRREDRHPQRGRSMRDASGQEGSLWWWSRRRGVWRLVMGWGLTDKKPSMQAREEKDVSRMKAPKAAAPWRLSQHSPTMPMAPAGCLGRWRDATGPSVQQESTAAAGRLQAPVLAVLQGIISRFLSTSTVQLVTEKRESFFQ